MKSQNKRLLLVLIAIIVTFAFLVLCPFNLLYIMVYIVGMGIIFGTIDYYWIG